jgi:hypothetical protein
MGESLIRPAGDASLVGNYSGCASENSPTNYQYYGSEAGSQLQLQQPQGYSVYVRTANDGGVNTSEKFSDTNNIHTFIGRGLYA